MPSPMTPQELVYDMVSVSQPSVSPDGSELVFVRSDMQGPGKSSRSRIMRTALPDGVPSQFTSGPRDSAPSFSPDGKRVAFLRPDNRGTTQLWTIGTGGGEARKLTDSAKAVESFAWSPGSDNLVFVSDVDPDAPPADADPDEPRVRIARRIRYRFDGVGWRGDAFRQLFIVDAYGGPTHQLTTGEGEDGAPAWSPDGERIAFVSDRREDRDITGFTETYVVGRGGGTPHLLSDGLPYSHNATWSPDGEMLAVVGSPDTEISDGRESAIFILEPGNRPMRVTEEALTVTTGTQMRWTDDGRLLFIASSRGESYLYELDLDGGGLRRIGDGGAQHSAVAFDAAGRRAVIHSVPPHSAGDLYFVDLADGTHRQLTNCNGGFFRRHPVGALEKFAFEREGMEIESRVWFPSDFDESGSYPLVVDIHGGPHGAFYDAFEPRQQALASAGYIVLCVNPRGSSSYGPEFLKAVLRDWGGEDYLDIMAAVDELAARPYVDESRMGVHGYSYGGFMSSWIVGHTTRFNAAVVGAPCINLSSMYGTSDIGIRFGEMQWGGLRKDALDKFLEHSPLTYAPNVETPVLLLHGEDDFRCPMEQSEQYFVSLKRLGKEVELVRFPGCSHGFMRTGHPKMREEYLARMMAWFDERIGPGAANGA